MRKENERMQGEKRPAGVRRRWIAPVASVLAVALLLSACAIYLGDYYRADMEAIASFAPMADASYSVLENGNAVFRSENATVGMIFYPGGKVEHTAYLPLMAACAERGILCVLVEMPFRLAVLDINAADGIREAYPEIEHWYIGGHSHGGAMAATYLAEHTEELDGLILLGSFSATDLSESDLSVLSVFGSEDRVMNREKYEEYKSHLPADFSEVVLDGGCHAYFGMYGAQDGDGEPRMTNGEQIERTAELMASHMLRDVEH